MRVGDKLAMEVQGSEAVKDHQSMPQRVLSLCLGWYMAISRIGNARLDSVERVEI